MLMNLQVRDFAIVEKIDIEFESGMTVLTGETGAGKSILVDALGLVLGERGSAQLVRDGAKRAEFAAEFDVGSLGLVCHATLAKDRRPPIDRTWRRRTTAETIRVKARTSILGRRHMMNVASTS